VQQRYRVFFIKYNLDAYNLHNSILIAHAHAPVCVWDWETSSPVHAWEYPKIFRKNLEKRCDHWDLNPGGYRWTALSLSLDHVPIHNGTELGGSTLVDTEGAVDPIQQAECRLCWAGWWAYHKALSPRCVALSLECSLVASHRFTTVQAKPCWKIQSFLFIHWNRFI
jgi:hypothetical protein